MSITSRLEQAGLGVKKISGSGYLYQVKKGDKFIGNLYLDKRHKIADMSIPQEMEAIRDILSSDGYHPLPSRN